MEFNCTFGVASNSVAMLTFYALNFCVLIHNGYNLYLAMKLTISSIFVNMDEDRKNRVINILYIRSMDRNH